MAEQLSNPPNTQVEQQQPETQADQEENTKSTTAAITPSRSSDSDKMTSIQAQVSEPTPQLSPTESQTDSHSESHSDSKMLEQTNHTLTGEEVDQLEQFKVKEGSVVWMMLGVTGAGKSTVGNFLLVQDNAFPESSDDMLSETERAALKCSSFDSENLCVIDTPGLGDTGNIGSFKSGSEDAAYDYSKLATELTNVMMMTDQGINAFLIVVSANQKDYHGFIAFLDFFDIIGAYWNHSILVVTHGKQRGKTEEEQYAKFHAVLAHPKGPAPLKNVLDKVSGRLVIVEAKDWRNQPEYHRSVVGKIMKYSKKITEQHGPFKDDLQSIGREAYEKAKLELIHEFEDMNCPEAQAAVFQRTFKHVRDVIYRLVRIKMVDDEDVDKMKDMAKVKEEELNEVRKQRDTLHKEYLEEQLRRKEAEKKQRQEEEKRRQAEERRRQAEERQRQEEEAKKQANERLRKEEEARRQAEEKYRKEQEVREKAEKIHKEELEAREKAAEKRKKDDEDARKQAEEKHIKELEARDEAAKKRRKDDEDAREQAEKKHRKELKARDEAEKKRRKDDEDARKQAEEKHIKELKARDEAEKKRRKDDEDARKQAATEKHRIELDASVAREKAAEERRVNDEKARTQAEDKQNKSMLSLQAELEENRRNINAVKWASQLQKDRWELAMRNQEKARLDSQPSINVEEVQKLLVKQEEIIQMQSESLRLARQETSPASPIYIRRTRSACILS